MALTVYIASLFGHLRDGVVHWCDRRWRRRWDVGLACGRRQLLGRNKWLPGQNFGPAGRRGDSFGRRWRFGRCCGHGGRLGGCRWLCRCRRLGGCWFCNNRKDSILRHGRADSGGGPLLVPIGDVVVMVWRYLARSRSINDHLRNGWNGRNTST